MTAEKKLAKHEKQMHKHLRSFLEATVFGLIAPTPQQKKNITTHKLRYGTFYQLALEQAEQIDM